LRFPSRAFLSDFAPDTRNSTRPSLAQ
jgi:hypothetical protein